MRTIKLTVALLACALLSPAIAQQFGDYKPHGFLSDYSQLKPQDEESGAFIYLASDRVGQYDTFLIDRIKIYLKEDAASKEIDPTELKEIADYFHETLVETLEPDYNVVNEPGEGVLRLRIAITDLVPNKPEASVVTLVVPFLWVGEAGSGAAEGKAGSTPFVGEATVEAELMDSQTSEQLGAYIESRVAKKYNWVHGVDDAVGDYVKAYSTWAYTKQAIDGWAKDLRDRLDAAQ